MEQVELYVGVSERGHQTAYQPLRQGGMQPLTLDTLVGAGGEVRFSSIWHKPAPAGNATWNSNEQTHADRPAEADQIALDVSLTISPLAIRQLACEAAVWATATPWPGLAWRSGQ